MVNYWIINTAFICCQKFPTFHFYHFNYEFVVFKCFVVRKNRIHSYLFFGEILLRSKCTEYIYMMSNGLWQPYSINITHTTVYNHFNVEFWSNECCFCCVKYRQHTSKCYIYTWCFKLLACPTLFPSHRFNPRGRLCPMSNKETHIYDKSDSKWRQHKNRKIIKERMCIRCIIILSGNSRGFGKQLFYLPLHKK